jgi:hypothetical protein
VVFAVSRTAKAATSGLAFCTEAELLDAASVSPGPPAPPQADKTAEANKALPINGKEFKYVFKTNHSDQIVVFRSLELERRRLAF